jgi:DNA-binding SARP family transcriptional activator
MERAMLHLQTLGGLDLRDSSGREFRSVLAQPKRLAILVYIALADSQRFRRRDALVALFWPELDADHARGALRQAMRFLRGELGPGALVNRGEEEVALDSTVVRCDAVDFSQACESQEWARAVELYRGDLLPGVFIADVSSEFEQWLEAERDRLRRRAVGAAWSLVEVKEREGDPVGAAPWARRAVELSPDDEAGVRRLMRILDRRGDRAGALSAFDAFRRRLAAQYGAVPSPETEALLANIRSRDVKIWESPLGGWPPPGDAR